MSACRFLHSLSIVAIVLQADFAMAEPFSITSGAVTISYQEGWLPGMPFAFSGTDFHISGVGAADARNIGCGNPQCWPGEEIVSLAEVNFATGATTATATINDRIFDQVFLDGDLWLTLTQPVVLPETEAGILDITAPFALTSTAILAFSRPEDIVFDRPPLFALDEGLHGIGNVTMRFRKVPGQALYEPLAVTYRFVDEGHHREALSVEEESVGWPVEDTAIQDSIVTGGEPETVNAEDGVSRVVCPGGAVAQTPVAFLNSPQTASNSRSITPED